MVPKIQNSRFRIKESSLAAFKEPPDLLHLRVAFFRLWLSLLLTSASVAEQTRAHDKPLSTEALTALVRPSVVTISVTGRAGEESVLGTGFVISPDGLIATNLHVLVEARPITVEFADGRKYQAESVHASDKSVDLAIIRVKAAGLKTLELAESSKVQDGQSVVAFGNPEGLKNSVVQGIVSGHRKLEGVPMLQLAIPIERGNSGGPVVDRQGRVLGILTIKAAYTRNLGFAVESKALRPLIARPNPIQIGKWLTIGALNPREWKTLFGSDWRQRAGRIQVKPAGRGFGGRSLCLSETKPLKLPYELAVSVKMENESGAAGLAFHSDGKHKHYGFYPTAGQLRLTRFDGPTVYTWTILDQRRTEDYRPGDWNRLRVRFEKEQFKCFVNDRLVFTSRDRGLTAGKIGLAKFRDTVAEFKGFQVGADLSERQPNSKHVENVLKAVWQISSQRFPSDEDVKKFADDPEINIALLNKESKALHARIAYVKELTKQVHRHQTSTQILDELKKSEDEISLLKIGLLIARLDNREVEVDAYLKLFDRMGEDLKAGLPEKPTERDKLDALNHYMFKEMGYHGSRFEYFHASNSYLNEVIDDREGLPIALSVIYMELAHRAGLIIEGVGLPRYFVVRCKLEKGAPQLIDVFEGGVLMSVEDAKRKVLAMTNRPMVKGDLKTSARKEIVMRMIRNLLGLAQNSEDTEQSIQYLDVLLALEPDDPSFRMMRGYNHYHRGDNRRSLKDVEWLLKRKPASIKIRRVEELHRRLKAELGKE